MTRDAVRTAVHRFISRLLEGRDDFDDNTPLVQLGLDKEDIEELIFPSGGSAGFDGIYRRRRPDAQDCDDRRRLEPVFLIEIGRY